MSRLRAVSRAVPHSRAAKKSAEPSQGLIEIAQADFGASSKEVPHDQLRTLRLLSIAQTSLLNYCQAFLPSRVEHDRQQNRCEEPVRRGQSLAPVIELFQFPGNDKLLGDSPLGSLRQVHQVILVARSDLSRNGQTDNEQRKYKIK
jgi:hypothetical protein